MSGPFLTDSRIIHPCCLFIMYSSILLFKEAYISFSNIGGRLSAPERIALSTRVVIEKFPCNVENLVNSKTANLVAANSVKSKTAHSVAANSVKPWTANSVAANSVKPCNAANSVNSKTANSVAANSVKSKTANSVSINSLRLECLDIRVENHSGR
ncbi:hypothetical protein Tco_0859118 [Tanacetum coccineum]|uniref:Uncharacterized protein n=1 Tax=Tanacetum coccineum TaxID=301880 RepID=A0ABQ5BES7_9ASTR